MSDDNFSDRQGTPFKNLPTHEQRSARSLARRIIEKEIVRLGVEAPHTPWPEIYRAVRQPLHEATGVQPIYFRTFVQNHYRGWLADADGGRPGKLFTAANDVTLPLPPRPSESWSRQVAKVAAKVDESRAEKIDSVDHRPVLDRPGFCDEGFTPYAALLHGEPFKSSVDEFDSLSLDAHVRALRLLINGSPQYGGLRTEPDADFIGWMQWRLARATGSHRGLYESRTEFGGSYGAGFQEKRVVVHLRALKWHLEGDERVSDFPTLLQEAYGLSRMVAWLIACAIIRAAYLADMTVAEGLADLCMERITNPSTVDVGAGKKTTLLKVKAIWLKLCQSAL